VAESALLLNFFIFTTEIQKSKFKLKAKAISVFSIDFIWAVGFEVNFNVDFSVRMITLVCTMKHVVCFITCCVVEVSDSDSDSSVIVLSDAVESEDELESLLLVDKSAAVADQVDQPKHCDADGYAAAVAAKFLNTSARTGQFCIRNNVSCATMLPEDVAPRNKVSGFDETVTCTEAKDMSGVITNVALSTCIDTKCTAADLLSKPTPFAASEVKVANIVSSTLNSGDTDICSELDNSLDPIELAVFSDVCDSSFLNDFSFVNKSLFEECSSSGLLACSVVNADTTRDTKLVSADVQHAEVNAYAGGVTNHHKLCQLVLTCTETPACDNVVSVAVCRSDLPCCQPYLTNSTRNVDDSTVSSSCSLSSLVKCSKLLISDSLHRDVNGSDLSNLSGSDTFVKDEGTDIKVMQDICGGLVTDTGSSKHLISAATREFDVDGNTSLNGTRKRSVPDEFSPVSSKRFRADDDLLSSEWLTTLDDITRSVVTNNADNTVDSATSSVSVGSTGCDSSLQTSYHELKNVICCHCNELHVMSSVSYCAGGHACCHICLQYRVKRLLTSPSKAQMLHLFFCYV